MSESLSLKFEIVGQDRASNTLREVTEALQTLDRQARKTAEGLKRAFSADLLKPMTTARAEAKSFGNDLAEAADRAAKALRGDVEAVSELRTALRGAVSEQKALSDAMRGSQAAGVKAARVSTIATRNAATASARAAATDLRMVRQRWRMRDASEQAERRAIDATGNAWAAAQRRRMGLMDRSAAVEARRQREASRADAVKARAETAAADRRIRDVGRVWQMRQASKAAELRHLRTMSRERSATRRHAMTSGRHALHHGHRAMRSLNHPVHESAGFALATGAAAGVGLAEHVTRAAVALDTSVTRLRMFAPQLDSEAIRKQALGDSVALGVDASVLVDSIAKSVRDGVPPAIAQTLPKSIVQTAQVMGGDIERLTDSLAEGIQEATAMGWIKDKTDARRFLNLEAGLSTTAGNTSEKTEQFIAAGGLGHGKEMGLDLEKTMAYGAMLNASGSRTGQASARFMGQLSQNVPKMFDKYRTAVDSHKNSEEDRAVRSAPAKLGYGSVREMQARIMAGPEGLIDFAARLQKLDDKARKLTLEGYGFSEQGGAMLAELGSNGGAKGKAVLARAHELAEQKEANDYLSEKFAEWQKSLSFMLQQVEKGWRAIENEVGDVIKSDIIAPFRDWWVEISEQIVHSDLKDRVHRAIMGFVHGLGFEDVRHMLASMTGNARGFDLAGFAKGIGEGIRAVVDHLRLLGGVFGGAGGISAETVGKVAAEMLGLSLALKAVSPVLAVMTGIVEAIRALGAVLKTAQALGLIMGVAGAGEGAGVLATLGAGAVATGVGLAAMLGVAVVGGALAVAVMNWDAIKAAMGLGPKEDPATAAARPVKRLEDQSLWDFLTGRGVDNVPMESDNDRVARLKAQAEEASRKASETLGIMRGPHGGVTGAPGGFHPSAFEGGGQNWRDLLTPASWEPSDAGEVARDAVVDTARGVERVRESVDRLGGVLRLAVVSGSGAAGGSTGAGDGGGTPNMRYGRGGSGRYRGTPGTGQDYDSGPKVSLGKMGAKFAEKAPVIMDGLMKKYGLTREQAAGIVGNLGHESQGFTAYHEGGKAPGKGGVGWAQWTGARRRAFETWTAAHGLNPTSDEASWRYLTEGDPETARAIQAVKGQSTRHGAMVAWEGAFERAGVKNYRSRDRYADAAFAGTPGGATVEGPAPGSASAPGGAGKAVDIAGRLNGMTSAQAGSALGSRMTPGEWCADFVNGALKAAGMKGSGSSMALSFQKWGHQVGFGDVKRGDVIVENHGRGHGHVGLATGAVQRDRNGNVTAIGMTSGNHGDRVHRDYWESVKGIEQLRRSNEDVAAAAAEATKHRSDDIAGKVPTHARPRPGVEDSGTAAGRMTSADNSTTVHNWHLYGEPARQAAVPHFPGRRSGSTTDLDAFG